MRGGVSDHQGQRLGGLRRGKMVNRAVFIHIPIHAVCPAHTSLAQQQHFLGSAGPSKPALSFLHNLNFNEQDWQRGSMSDGLSKSLSGEVYIAFQVFLG